VGNIYLYVLKRPKPLLLLNIALIYIKKTLNFSKSKNTDTVHLVIYEKQAFLFFIAPISVYSYVRYNAL
jgi:hypothetical protein